MEVNNNKQKKLTIIAVVTLIALVAGATYAYFSVGTTSNFGTSTINATADNIGTVTLNGSNANLNLHVTAVDMAQGENSINYYATPDGTSTDEAEKETVIGTASVSPTTDTNYYHCTYTLQVSQSYSGDKNMYNIFKGTQQVDGNTYTGSANELVLLVNGTSYDLNTNTLPKEIPGEFYIKGTQTVNITAGLMLVNLADKNQNMLAGSGVNISIQVKQNSFTCVAEEEPVPASTTLIALTEDENNASKISRYTGPVTDECSASSCTTVQQAQNVYVFTSNDINNVIFEGYCWKIIRTTETHGVKLLYDGTPVTNVDHQECLTTNDKNRNSQIGKLPFTDPNQSNSPYSPAYVGYMYNKTTGTLREMLYGVTQEEVNNETYGTGVYSEATNVNVTSSSFKTTLESWLINDSDIDTSKLEDAVYCNDRRIYYTNKNLDEVYSYANSDDNVNFYGEDGGNISVTLKCENQTDSFNTVNIKAKTNAKVGFITMPEAKLMGALRAKAKQAYWTGSPSIFGNLAKIAAIDTAGGISDSSATSSTGIRPVVSVNTGVQITGGDGSFTSPFIFE